MDPDDPLAGDPGGGGDDKVVLGADVQPWEAALDKAAAKVNEWAGTVESKFKAAGEKITGFTSKASTALSDLEKKGGGDIAKGLAETAGDFVGGKLGAVLGSSLGPVGTLVGNQLGGLIGGRLAEAVAGTLDSELIGTTLRGLFKGVDATVKDVGERWATVKLDAQDALDAIRERLSGLSLPDLMAKDWGGIKDELTTLFDDLTNIVNDFGKQTTARLADLIDAAFERFREPIGAIADAIQQLLVKLGLIDAGTAKWSETLEELEDVGLRVIGAIGYAVGTLKDALDVVAGTLLTALAPAFGTVAEMALRGFAAIGDALDAMPDGVKELLGGGFDKGAQQFRDAADFVAKQTEKLTQSGIDRAARGLQFGTGAEYRDRFRRGAEEGRTINEDVDFQRWWDQFLDDLVASLETGAKSMTEAGQVTAKTLTAVYDGTREAARLAAADANRGASGDPMVRKADEQIRAIDKTTKAVNDVVKAIKDKPAPGSF